MSEVGIEKERPISEADIPSAIARIDEFLGELTRRDLASTKEVVDVLLEVRFILQT